MPNLQSRELFACSSNLPLSLLTGLADGLALKDRATRHSGRDSPQLLGPPISVLCVLAEIQRKCARHVSRAPLLIHSLVRVGSSEPNLSSRNVCCARCREHWSPEPVAGWA